MTGVAAHIAAMGIVSAIGCGVEETLDSLYAARRGLSPIMLFAVPADQIRPAGIVTALKPDARMPRTHLLARLAADQIFAESGQIPDAIVLGTTTGGIATTETLMAEGVQDPEQYRRHALSSVGEDLARRCGCTGPVITISTACSSGAAAIVLALQLLRDGLARRVLAGGVDSLCRLTYFGFNALQLIDPLGARPLDRDRKGMSVAEGAAMLLLTTDSCTGARMEICGAGLSCDAYHPTTPHPQGAGALSAMRAAMRDAGVTPADIDYISLHGTGTRDNDLAEERAVQTLFGDDAPAASSIKGATGHSLAAAGAIEAVVAGLSIAHGLVPGNPGFSRPDPEMKLKPVAIPKKAPVATVLSNSFGFGGNNAALVIRRHGHASTSSIVSGAAPSHLTIAGRACVTGAGKTEATWQAIEAGESCAGVLDEGPLSQGLPPRAIRRLKRLPKMAMALAADLCAATSETLLPGMVIMGTAWGALSETHDFLKGVIDSNGRFPSPTDFIGSVHNAPAGQIAMMLGAKGANITVSGGDCSFEQALLTADLLTRNHPVSLMVTAADEHHPVFSPLFDASVRQAGLHADGGGALLLSRQKHPAGPSVALLHLRAGWEPEAVAALIHRLGGGKQIEERFGAVLVGLPAGCRDQAQRQLTAFLTQTRFEGPLVDYRRYLGEFASASAVAAVLAAQMVMQRAMPGGLTQGKTCHLNGKGILVLGLGEQISAVGIMPA